MARSPSRNEVFRIGGDNIFNRRLVLRDGQAKAAALTNWFVRIVLVVVFEVVLVVIIKSRSRTLVEDESGTGWQRRSRDKPLTIEADDIFIFVVIRRRALRRRRRTRYQGPNNFNVFIVWNLDKGRVAAQFHLPSSGSIKPKLRLGSGPF